MWQRKQAVWKAEGRKGRWGGGVKPKLRGVHFIWKATKNYKLFFIKGLTYDFILIVAFSKTTVLIRLDHQEDSAIVQGWVNIQKARGGKISLEAPTIVHSSSYN